VWSYYVQSGIKSSPAIGLDGTIYVGTEGIGTVNSDGRLYAINPDGLLVWYCDTRTAIFDVSSPVIGPDGTIYIGSISNDYSLYAFTQLGSIKWKYVTTGQIYDTPSVGSDGNIVVTCYGTSYLYKIYPSGSLIWKISINAAQYPSPVIGSDGKIYVSADSLYAFYPSGSLQWKSLINFYPQTPTIGNNGLIYAGSGSTIYLVGTLLSTFAPSPLPIFGLDPYAEYVKFQGNNNNTVNFSR
jgi:hypothetical protein